MRAWWQCLPVILLLLAGACVVTGTKAITDKSTISRIEIGKSTKNDVPGLLGYPYQTLLSGQGEEQWQYWYTCETPRPTEFIPVAKGFANDLHVRIRTLTVTFDQAGVVKDLDWSEASENLN